MKKSRLNTEQKILTAVKTILLKQGFAAIGINEIARTAGCDKVLIYRYFGGLDGLLKSFAEQNDLWWSVDELITDELINEKNLASFLDKLLKKHIQQIQSRPLTQEIMAWELSDHNELTIALARTRSERGMLLVKKIRLLFNNPNKDIGGILGIFGAAVNYLVIRTRKLPVEHAKEEWWRFEQSLTKLLNNTN